MYIYALIYIVVFILAIISEKYVDKKDKKDRIIFWISTLLAIVIPATISGLRDINIGNDTSGYVLSTFEFAVNKYSLIDIIDYCNVEPLYALMNLIVASVTSNINVLLFVLQLFINVIFFSACYNLKNNQSYALTYTLFTILFFNKSLNMVRQTIAIGLILLSYREAVNNRFVRYSILNIIAMLFHKTAIIAFPIFFILKLINGKNSRRNIIIIVCVTILVIILFRPIIMLLININVLDKRYENYININSDIILLELLFMGIVLTISISLKKKLIEMNNYNKSYMVFLSISIILYCLGIFNTFACRLAYYYYYFVIFLIEEIVRVIVFQKDKKITKIAYAITILLNIIYSSIYYGYYKLDNTVPYKTYYNTIERVENEDE